MGIYFTRTYAEHGIYMKQEIYRVKWEHGGGVSPVAGSEEPAHYDERISVFNRGCGSGGLAGRVRRGRHEPRQPSARNQGASDFRGIVTRARTRALIKR